jgi:hypothetical protein
LAVAYGRWESLYALYVKQCLVAAYI